MVDILQAHKALFTRKTVVLSPLKKRVMLPKGIHKMKSVFAYVIAVVCFFWAFTGEEMVQKNFSLTHGLLWLILGDLASKKKD